jgi:D-alanine-D-alanine ligase
MKRGRSRRVAFYGAVADATARRQDVLVEVETVQRALAGPATPRWRPLTSTSGGAGAAAAPASAFVFNLVESVEGLGRLIHLAPALLDSLGLPYTGAGAEAAFLTSNKPVAKKLLAGAGIATPAWAECGTDGLVAPDFPGPYIVKSVWEHASIGLDGGSIVADPARLGGVLRARRRRFGGDWFAERFIDGREFNLSLLAAADGVELLPLAEMCFVDYPPGKPRIVDYAAKWHVGSFEFATPCRSVRATDRSCSMSGGDGAGVLAAVRPAALCASIAGSMKRALFRVEVNVSLPVPDAGFAAAAAAPTRLPGSCGASSPAAAVPAAGARPRASPPRKRWRRFERRRARPGSRDPRRVRATTRRPSRRSPPRLLLERGDRGGGELNKAAAT